MKPQRPNERTRAHLTAGEIFFEAVLSLSGRAVRLVLLVLATALGIGTLVATIGMGQTGSRQISDRLDAVTSTQATVRAVQKLDPSGKATMPWDADQRVERLNGVVSAGLLAELDSSNLRVAGAPVLDPTEPPVLAPAVLASTPGLLATLTGTLATGRYLSRFDENQHERVVVLGQNAADRLNITRIDNQPTVFIGPRPYVVVGIIADARLPKLLDAVILPQATARGDFGLSDPGDLKIRLQLGAGDIVADQAAKILDPSGNAEFEVVAPPATTNLRENLLGDTNLVFLVVGAVALVIGGLSIAIISTMAVLERRGEIGLRRALGATRLQLLLQVLTESLIIGLLGGLIGAASGTVTVLIVSGLNHWPPVIDPRIHVTAVLLGAVVGLLAGTVPALKAAGLEPSTALQQGIS